MIIFYNERPKFSYGDVSVMPTDLSYIDSRKECNPFSKNFNGNLPIFTAPMSTVVSLNNFNTFEANHITPILPRNIDFDMRYKYVVELGKWAAFSMDEFYDTFASGKAPFDPFNKYHVLIDVANGHMGRIYDIVKVAKSIYKSSLVVMVGNIANPVTYRHCCEAGVDYVRVGIGSGFGCLTTSNTSVHYPMGSLISEMYEQKEGYFNKKFNETKTYPFLTKIIADGGIRNYSDVIKALALGADCVMIGSLFAQCLDSAADTHIYNKDLEVDHHYTENDYDAIVEEINNYKDLVVEKIFYGMASKNGQKDLGCKEIKTAEGIVKRLPVKGTIEGWSKNMADYLRSAMSYTGIKNIEDFNPEKVNLIFLTECAREAINK